MDREQIIEVLWKAIDNAFAFENYDGPKSEQDLTKSVESFAAEIMELSEQGEEPISEAKKHEILQDFTAKLERHGFYEQRDPEFNMIVQRHFWDLLESTPPSEPKVSAEDAINDLISAYSSMIQVNMEAGSNSYDKLIERRNFEEKKQAIIKKLMEEYAQSRHSQISHGDIEKAWSIFSETLMDEFSGDSNDYMDKGGFFAALKELGYEST